MKRILILLAILVTATLGGYAQKRVVKRPTGKTVETRHVRKPVVKKEGSSEMAPVVHEIHVPEAVDLGLSVMWASFNLGAFRPEEYGNYYKWGETKPADGYGWKTYKYAKGGYDKLTKYCSESDMGYRGFTDGKEKLDAEDDAATVCLGGAWRMPTSKEIKELMEKCKREWTTLNGINGTLVTGPNGNSIFVPASGQRAYETGKFINIGEDGSIWSSDRYDDSYKADYFVGYDANWLLGSWDRVLGFPVRAVMPK